MESGPPPAQKLPHSICLDCHRNYNGDPFDEAHATHNIQCVDCHGDSIEHTGDESNFTPPGVMYARDVINKKCLECHSLRKKMAPEVIERKRHRQMVQIERKDITCMDCHGERHLMRLRTIVWDKKTGKLLSKSSEQSSENRPQKVKK
jgi:formate-dependent nitrite reductase cytochrome c552 subunit